jgi:hypothetical protein
MATARVTANTTPQTLFTVPRHAKGRLTALVVDNQGAAPRTVRLQDVFTPSPSAGNASPTQQTVERLQVTVAAGATVRVPETELRDVEFLGEARAVASATDPATVIICAYSLQ